MTYVDPRLREGDNTGTLCQATLILLEAPRCAPGFSTPLIPSFELFADVRVGQIGGTVVSLDMVSRETSQPPGCWGIERPVTRRKATDTLNGPGMVHLDGYRIRVRYKGLEGLSQIGFKKQDARLEDLFPTADELVLSTKAYFHKLDESAALMYEVPNVRFGVVENNGILELAVPNPRGDYVGLIIDVLALDVTDTQMMMDDIERTCGFVRAKLRDAIGIMEMSEDDYVQRLRDSMRLLANELRR